MNMTDLEYAKKFCADRGMIYLSHETYITGASHQVWIAVEDASGRYEIRKERSMPDCSDKRGKEA